MNRNMGSVTAGILAVVSFLARGLYAGFKLIPTQDKVTFISRGQTWTSTDFRLLAEQVHAQSPSTRIVILNHPVPPKVVYPFKVLVEMFHVATSRAVVVDTYNIVVSVFRHKTSLHVLQIWHALGAFKAFGLMALDKAEGSSHQVASVMKMHRNYTHVTAASSATAEIFQKCFGVSADHMIIAGSPRVDFLTDVQTQAAQRNSLRAKYGIDDNRKVVVFAPTFRKGRALPIAELIDAFDFDAFTLVFRKHPLDNLTVATDSRIVIPDEREAIEILAMADHLVTDYSAVAFEASLLDVSMIFWAFDLDEYAASRGFMMDFESEAPGPIVHTGEEVVAALSGARDFGDKRSAFTSRYVETRGFNNAQRLASTILGGTA